MLDLFHSNGIYEVLEYLISTIFAAPTSPRLRIQKLHNYLLFLNQVISRRQMVPECDSLSYFLWCRNAGCILSLSIQSESFLNWFPLEKVPGFSATTVISMLHTLTQFSQLSIRSMGQWAKCKWLICWQLQLLLYKCL